MPENTVLKAKEDFSVGAKSFTAKQTITMSEGAYLLELEKGWEERKDKRGNVVSKTPHSGYVNHCGVISCSKKTKDAFSEFLKKGE